MPLGSPRAAWLLAELVAALGVCWSTMVEVDEERLNVLASGARCVSLSSAACVRKHNGRSAGLHTLGELPRHGGSGAAGDGRLCSASSAGSRPGVGALVHWCFGALVLWCFGADGGRDKRGASTKGQRESVSAGGGGGGRMQQRSRGTERLRGREAEGQRCRGAEEQRGRWSSGIGAAQRVAMAVEMPKEARRVQHGLFESHVWLYATTLPGTE